MIFGAIPIVGLTYAILKNPKEEMTEFSKSPIGLSILLSFFLFSFGFFCYKYFLDKKTKLIIDKDGIWTSKFGQVKWQSVWYIYQKEMRGKFIEQKLIIKLNEDDKEIKLDTTYFDKTEDEIIAALKGYSSKFNVQFLDKEIQKVY
ncbi:MAG TPA: hypothetical protein VK492_18415 [Chitinophagaceae bacterium]|nr:hypothetical protein [Chitinophagaceae bacterium]